MDNLMTLCVLINTIVMALDRYGIDENEWRCAISFQICESVQNIQSAKSGKNPEIIEVHAKHYFSYLKVCKFICLYCYAPDHLLVHLRLAWNPSIRW